MEFAYIYLTGLSLSLLPGRTFLRGTVCNAPGNHHFTAIMQQIPKRLRLLTNLRSADGPSNVVVTRLGKVFERRRILPQFYSFRSRREERKNLSLSLSAYTLKWTGSSRLTDPIERRVLVSRDKWNRVFRRTPRRWNLSSIDRVARRETQG